MTFAQPFWFFGLAIVFVLGALAFANDRRDRRRLVRLVADRLLPNLADPASRSGKMFRRILSLGAITALLVALTRPQFGFTEQEFARRGRDIMLAIDTSKSMLSTDIPPDRLSRAKLAAQDVVNAMSGDRLGVIAFAGSAQVEAPLTIDYQTVLEAINELDTKTVEKGGTDISSSIYSARLALGKSPQSSQSLVLFTDGEDLDEDSVAAAKEAAAAGIRIFTVGVGTKEGSLIPAGTDGQGYLRDRNGQPVVSHLDEKRLRQIAQETGGFYLHLDSEGVSRLISEGLRSRDLGNVGNGSSRIPIERYRWPLSIALLLLFLSVLTGGRQKKSSPERSLAQGALLAALLSTGLSTKAASGLDHYNQGDFEGALQSFREELKNDPNSPVLNFNAGDAAYRAGKFEEAFESYSKAMLTPDPGLRQQAYYNAGNTLFMQGNMAQEIERQLANYYDARYQYQQAIDLNPADEQTKKNLALLEQRIKQAEKQKLETRQKRPSGRSRRQRKQPDPNLRQKQQNGPDQQEEGQKSEEDKDRPGDGSEESDAEQNKEGSMAEPTPDKQKNGPVQELAPSDEPPKELSAPTDEKRGQISEEEALGLLNSLKNEGEKIDLMRRKNDRTVSRDW